MDIIEKINKKIKKDINERKYDKHDVEVMIDELKSNIDELNTAFISIGDKHGIKQIKLVRKEIHNL